MSEDPNSFLPTKQTKLWNSKVRKDENWKPLRPNFCPCLDEETGKKCGSFMNSWDIMFYEQYGMCEKCYHRYNKDNDIKITTENNNADTSE